MLNGITGSARTYARFCLGRFIDHLIEAGVATAAEPPANTARIRVMGAHNNLDIRRPRMGQRRPEGLPTPVCAELRDLSGGLALNATRDGRLLLLHCFADFSNGAINLGA